jgi:hypothetical protein
MKLTLKCVSEKDYKFLYDLLKNRNPKENISHRDMPTYREHLRFIKNHTYSKYYIIYIEDIRIGRVYITEKGEIGISLLKKYNRLKKILFKNFSFHPLVKFVNVSPKNKLDQKILKSLGYKIIQYTYENISA